MASFHDTPMIDTEKRSASIHHPVAGLIAERRSTRAYSSRPLEQDTLISLFEAVRWAPSSSNEQPWYYLYATTEQTELRERLTEVLASANQVWASKAPVLILSLARVTHLRDGRPNPYAFYDVGAANALLSLQAVELGLQVRQMGGFDKVKAKESLNIPVGLEPVVIIAVGYPGDAVQLPEALQAREAAPRERYLQETFVRNVPF